MPSVPSTLVWSTSFLYTGSRSASALGALLRVTEAPPCSVATLPTGSAGCCEVGAAGWLAAGDEGEAAGGAGGVGACARRAGPGAAACARASVPKIITLPRMSIVSAILEQSIREARWIWRNFGGDNLAVPENDLSRRMGPDSGDSWPLVRLPPTYAPAMSRPRRCG